MSAMHVIRINPARNMRHSIAATCSPITAV
jgi:hypothetical protein